LPGRGRAFGLPNSISRCASQPGLLHQRRCEPAQPGSVELYRQEGTDFRSVQLYVRSDGVRLVVQDMGPLVERTRGDADYEFWVDVPAKKSPVEAMPSMNFGLFAKKKGSTTKQSWSQRSEMFKSLIFQLGHDPPSV
jgi:hypothetical protein